MCSGALILGVTLIWCFCCVFAMRHTDTHTQTRLEKCNVKDRKGAARCWSFLIMVLSHGSFKWCCLGMLEILEPWVQWSDQAVGGGLAKLCRTCVETDRNILLYIYTHTYTVYIYIYIYRNISMLPETGGGWSEPARWQAGGISLWEPDDPGRCHWSRVQGNETSNLTSGPQRLAGLRVGTKPKPWITKHWINCDLIFSSWVHIDIVKNPNIEIQ